VENLTDICLNFSTALVMLVLDARLIWNIMSPSSQYSRGTLSVVASGRGKLSG